MYAYQDIKELHLELTDKCNAACPQCPRNDHGGPANPLLSLTELTLEDVRTMVPPPLVRQLRRVYACGNFGDPVVARDCVPIFDYLRTCHPGVSLGIHTNGGARPVQFWQALARLMPKGKGYVRFGIDGLADTNHIYRRHVRWPVVMRNVKAFIAAGGNAEWNYLVFSHNEHQIEQARTLAAELGFSLFNVKKTGRFVDYTTMAYVDSTPIKGADGAVVGHLERPVDPAHQNRALDRLQTLAQRHGSMQRYLDAAEIRCKVQSERSLYISCDGHVLPCCWLAGHVHLRGGAGRRQFLGVLEQLGGTGHVDARRRSIQEIVEDDLFQRLLPESWDQPTCGAGKLVTCARVCGREFDRRSVQNSTRRRAAPAEHLRQARRYRDGEGVEKDYRRAFSWYRLALQGDASPALRYEVGELFRTGGPGLPEDVATALRWYREAAEQGSPWAQYRLGEAYRTGHGTARDVDEAARCYALAAEAGHAWAQYWLSECFRTGRGRPQDGASAIAWLRRSAEQGNRRAIRALDALHHEGRATADG